MTSDLQWPMCCPCCVVKQQIVRVFAFFSVLLLLLLVRCQCCYYSRFWCFCFVLGFLFTCFIVVVVLFVLLLYCGFFPFVAFLFCLWLFCACILYYLKKKKILLYVVVNLCLFVCLFVVFWGKNVWIGCFWCLLLLFFGFVLGFLFGFGFFVGVIFSFVFGVECFLFCLFYSFFFFVFFFFEGWCVFLLFFVRMREIDVFDISLSWNVCPDQRAISKNSKTKQMAQ